MTLAQRGLLALFHEVASHHSDGSCCPWAGVRALLSVSSRSLPRFIACHACQAASHPDGLPRCALPVLFHLLSLGSSKLKASSRSIKNFRLGFMSRCLHRGVLRFRPIARSRVIGLQEFVSPSVGKPFAVGLSKLLVRHVKTSRNLLGLVVVVVHGKNQHSIDFDGHPEQNPMLLSQIRSRRRSRPSSRAMTRAARSEADNSFPPSRLGTPKPRLLRNVRVDMDHEVIVELQGLLGVPTFKARERQVSSQQEGVECGGAEGGWGRSDHSLFLIPEIADEDVLNHLLIANALGDDSERNHATPRPRAVRNSSEDRRCNRA